MFKIINKNLVTEINILKQRLSFETKKAEAKIVAKIIDDVKKNKDKAILKYTKQFDCSSLNDLKVSIDDIEAGFYKTPAYLLSSIRKAIENIKRFHQKQIPNNFELNIGQNSNLAWQAHPLKRVGIYVPGGRASYPSSVLMNAIPAQVAGVDEIAMACPCDQDGNINPTILTVAKELGINEIYKMGGAQAIAGLAYGTETIRPVDKITGPGNIFVTLAKKMVFGDCGIDKLAGPSDVLVLADETANPYFIALELLAQAEHDIMSSAILLTTDINIANATIDQFKKLLVKLKNKETISKAIKNYGAIILTSTRAEMLSLAELIAPEHLVLMIKDAKLASKKIRNAGAIFVGNFSPVSIGDYISGTNHILPTGGSARFASALSVYDFINFVSINDFSKSDLFDLKTDIQRLAESEGLSAHSLSVEGRFI